MPPRQEPLRIQSDTSGQAETVPPEHPYYTGDNYRVELIGKCIHCQVWSRPDLDSTRGAELAEETVRLLSGPAGANFTRMLYDLSLAPVVIGPRTQSAITKLLRQWSDRHVAICIGPSATQRLQFQRLLSSLCLPLTELFSNRDQALGWLNSFQVRTSQAPLEG